MMNISEIKNKIKNNKLILIILIIGVVFLFLPSGKEEVENYEGVYERELAAETENIIKKIKGAGRVSVMISFYDKGKAVPVTDKSGRSGEVNEKAVSVSGKLALLKEEYPKVRGVVVVCDGGNVEEVRRDIMNAVSALTGAPIHNIKVFKMEG